MSTQERVTSPSTPLSRVADPGSGVAEANEVIVQVASQGEQKPERTVTEGRLTWQQQVYLTFVPIIIVLIIYLRQTVDGMGGNETTYTLLILACFILYPRGSAARAESAVAVVQQAPLDLEQAKPKAAPAARLYYLDNLKCLMTFLVVMHHITIGYGGNGGGAAFVVGNYHNTFAGLGTAFLSVNQSFFMCLFFFISGYFTPSSLARKGTRDFIQDKFMRLGLPLFVYFFILNGLIVWFAVTVVQGENFPANYWQAGTGPPWYVQVLLLFSVAFAVIMGDSELPSIRCPSTCTLLLLGAVVGLVQGLFVKIDFSMWNIPLAQGSMPFDIMFFYGGCLAKKNKWLEDFQERMMPSCAVRCLRTGVLIQIVLVYAAVLTNNESPYHKMPIAGRVLAPTTQVVWSSDDIGQMIFQVMSGVMTMSLSMCITQIFSAYGNFTNKTTKFFSEAAYGVYILHPVVWPIVSYTYVQLLRANNVELSFSLSTDWTIVSTDEIGTLPLVLGWLYTLFFSNLILWPCAFFLRKLPGLRSIL